MALKAKAQVFAATSGVLSVLRRGDAWRGRGADWSSPGSYELVATVPFATSQLRQVDAAALGDAASGISRKVRAQLPPGVSTTDCVAIGGAVYDVTRLDREGRLSWLYLTELASDGTLDLLPGGVSYDTLGLPARSPTAVTVRYRAASWGRSTGDAPMPSASVRVRALDWDGERELRVGGETYAVTGAEGDGEWVTLACARGVAQLGR